MKLWRERENERDEVMELWREEVMERKSESYGENEVIEDAKGRVLEMLS